jgi:hypothetical protein
MALFVIHSLYPLRSLAYGIPLHTLIYDLNLCDPNRLILNFYHFFRMLSKVYFNYIGDINVIPCMFEMYDLKMKRNVLTNGGNLTDR